MMRIDPSVTPTMAKAPTLGRWELDLLRTVEHVVRLGHVRTARRGRLDLDGGTVPLADDALVVHCAADGLKQRPRRADLAPDVITLQPVRAGFPCFGAALVGYVEATRDDDAEKNRLCPPSSFGNSLDRLGPDERPRLPRLGGLRRRSPTSRPGPTASRSTLPGCRPSSGSPELDAVLDRLAGPSRRGSRGSRSSRPRRLRPLVRPRRAFGRSRRVCRCGGGGGLD